MKKKTKELRLTKKKQNYLFFKIIVGTLLVLYTIAFLGLLIYTLLNSFKDSWSFIVDPIGFPKEFHFENYATIFDNMYLQTDPTAPRYYIESMFLGSVGYSLLGALGCIIATTITAYACAKFPCFLSKIIYVLAIVMITVPIIGSLPSEMQTIKSLGFYDNLWSIFILKFSFGNIYFLLLYEAFKHIPNDFMEAAEIDGASKLRIMLRIMIPMVGGIIGSIFLIQFIAFWNDYSAPVLYFPSTPNIAVGLIDFTVSTRYEISAVPLKLGSCIIAVIPMLVVFIIFREKIMTGVASGGIKG